MNPNDYLPHPCARRLVRSVLEHYPYGLTSTELRRRCSRAGTIYTVDAEGKNVTESLDETLEHLLDAGLIEQRLVGRFVRYIDNIKFPTTTEQNPETHS